jgi:starch synthase
MERHPAVLLSHPTGNQNVRNAVRSLFEHRMLAEFWTAVACNPESRWYRLLPAAIRAQVERRVFPEAPTEKIKCVPSREAARVVLTPTFVGRILCSGERPFSVIGMYRHFDGRVARRLGKLKPDIVYAYEGGALMTFREAKKLGITTCYELPSSFWYWEHKLLCEESQRNPNFAELLPKLKDSPAHMQWKDEELALADYIFVPSDHVQRTLAGIVPEEKIRVISYGAPKIRTPKRISRDPTLPLKVLFVGALTQRKGIGYLLSAIDRLGKQVELIMVGRRFAPNQRVDDACRCWRWFETMPHERVLELMQECDVLVLPSLAEGCALVVMEALSCGLPVVVTPNTGVSTAVRDGQEGYVVPISSADAIAERLDTLCRDRELLAAMSRRAWESGAEHSWGHYRTEWAEALRSVAWH